MSGIGTIPDINGYNTRMSMSLIDKIYFMDKIGDANLIVDFGCADGAILKHLAKLFPDYQYVGFDISPEMLEIARNGSPSNITYTSNWDEVLKLIEGKKAAITLSSLIHEVYTYCSEKEVEEFWGRVWNSCFSYVVIREMMVSKSASRQSDPIAVARIRQCYDKNKLQEWETQWGSLTENWSLVHFLLTYRYTENWEREFRENYLPVALEDFFPLIPPKYYPTFMEHYTLPFNRKTIEQDFGIQLQDRTHLKLILELHNEQ